MFMSFLGIFTDQVTPAHRPACVGMLMAFALRLLTDKPPAAFRMSMALALRLAADERSAAFRMGMAFAFRLAADKRSAAFRMFVALGFLQLTYQHFLLFIAAFVVDMRFHFFQLADQFTVGIVAIVIMRMHHVVRITADQRFLSGYRIVLIAVFRMFM